MNAKPVVTVREVMSTSLHIVDGLATVREAIDVMHEHSWPGNVRELRLVLLRAIVDGRPNADVLTADAVREALDTARLPTGGASLPLPCILDRDLKRIEVETMKAARRAANGNHALAGRKVGMGKDARNFKRDLGIAAERLDKLEAKARRRTTDGSDDA